MQLIHTVLDIGPGGLCVPPAVAVASVAWPLLSMTFFFFSYLFPLIAFHPLQGYPGSLSFMGTIYGHYLAQTRANMYKYSDHVNNYSILILNI